MDHLYSFSFKQIPSFLLGICALILLSLTQITKPDPSTVVRDLIAPPPQLNRFSFGYQEVIADTLWIRAVQDFDYCDKAIGKNICINNSWLFKMLDTITDLSPNFRIPYAAGGLALTVIITDIDGATKIFDKGVKAFPNDWTITYRAAYHYLYELNNKKRAAELLIQTGQNGGPSFVYALAGRLYSDSGNVELAEALLREMTESKQDPLIIERLRKKIESMRK